MKPISIYDEVSFPSFPHAPSHPQRLATIARLRGLTVPALRTSRVLELGCGTGGNLIPLAESLPLAEFVGVDLSPQQIALGQEHAAAIGLQNLRLQAVNILELDLSLGNFDFIICHGVYSWTTAEARAKILSLMNQLLTADGIAYLNFNTYPGWHVQSLVRDALSIRSARWQDPADRVQEARATIDFLIATLPTQDSTPGGLLRRELDSVQHHDDAYLFHAFLNVVNAPFYLQEVVEAAEQGGLQYIGDAEPTAMWPAAIDPALHHQLQRLLEQRPPREGRYIVDYEQLYDMVRFAASRRSLFCRGPRSVHAAAQPAQLAGMHLSAQLQRQQTSGNAPPGTTTWVAAGNRKIATGEPHLLATLQLLSEAWPESRPWEEIVREARQPVPPPNAAMKPSTEEQWGSDVLRCFAAGVLEVSVAASSCAKQVPERPQASPLARRQARLQSFVTNLRHSAVRCNELDQQVLQQLDGTRDAATIATQLGSDVSAIQQSFQRLAALALLKREPEA